MRVESFTLLNRQHPPPINFPSEVLEAEGSGVGLRGAASSVSLKADCSQLLVLFVTTFLAGRSHLGYLVGHLGILNSPILKSRRK